MDDKMKNVENFAAKRTPRKRGKPNSLAPRTLSISCASTVIYLFGVIFFLVGAYVLASVFISSGFFMMVGWTTLSRGRFGLFTLIVLCGGSLIAGHDLKRMEKTAAVLALELCFVIICLSAFIYTSPFDYLLPQPLYLNFIWLWSLPIATIILILKNWSKMEWRSEMRVYFGKSTKKEK